MAHAQLARGIHEASRILDRSIVPRQHEDEIHWRRSTRAQTAARRDVGRRTSGVASPTLVAHGLPAINGTTPAALRNTGQPVW